MATGTTTHLVTGAAGFIGSHLAERLIAEGHAVVGLDDLSTGRRANLPTSDRFEFVRGDLRDPETVRSTVEGVDWVFHQAAVPSVPRSLSETRTVTEANCLGTTHLLEACRDADVRTVVVASSTAVYGTPETVPTDESVPVDPGSPYALSKYWTERLALQFDRHHDLPAVALRYFNVYGPRQDPAGDYAAVVPAFVDRALSGRPLTVHGDGEQSRDFVYVGDVVDANLAAARSDCRDAALNVGTGRETTINDLAAAVDRAVDRPVEVVHDDPRPGDVRRSVADVSRAREAIGYEPSVDLETGLARTVDYFRDHAPGDA